KFENLRIRETQLGALPQPLSVDEREILGMGIEVLFGVDQVLERVDEPAIGDMPAHRVRQLLEVAVASIPQRPGSVQRFPVVRLAILKRGLLADIERWNNNRFSVRNPA